MKYTVETNSDGEFWYNNGELHREDGPAVIYGYGLQQWYNNGRLHREDGPAVSYPNGRQVWCKYGVFHREDGPAVICSNGDKLWYINGKQMTEHDFNARKKSLDGKEVTIDGKTYILKIKD